MENYGASADLLNEIGNLTLDLLDSDQANFLIYAEVEEGMIGVSVFWDHGEHVKYFFPSTELSMKIYELWHVPSDDKRWSAMSYFLTDGKVHVEFDYGENWSDDEFSMDRRDRVLEAHFPNQIVTYPPLPGPHSNLT